jgi:hypothetical protein
MFDCPERMNRCFPLSFGSAAIDDADPKEMNRIAVEKNRSLLTLLKYIDLTGNDAKVVVKLDAFCNILSRVVDLSYYFLAG